jgi:hypothetical protein
LLPAFFNPSPAAPGTEFSLKLEANRNPSWIKPVASAAG